MIFLLFLLPPVFFLGIFIGCTLERRAWNRLIDRGIIPVPRNGRNHD